MPLTVETIFIGVAQQMWQVFLWTWWLFVPIFLFFIAKDLWLSYIRFNYINSIKWTTLKVRTPPDIKKSPKAMEQVFAAAYASYSYGIRPIDKYIKGKVEDWYSFEIVGNASGVHFFIRLPEQFRNLIESAIYAQYPQAEIEVVNDYMEEFPPILPNDTYDLFGSEFILAKEDPYPLRTYKDFESAAGDKELDSLSHLLEIMSSLKGSEQIWLQLLIRPVDDNWKKKADELINKLVGRKEEKKVSAKEHLTAFLKNLLLALFKNPQWPEGSKSEKPPLVGLTKGEQEVIKAIEDKASKIGFEGALRFVYVNDKTNFNRGNIAAVMGALKQFNTLNLNGLRPNLNTMPIARPPFKKIKVYKKKRDLYDSYRFRFFPAKVSIFNTEELATLYHFPSAVVAAPGLQPVEFKKGAPPPNLPV